MTATPRCPSCNAQGTKHLARQNLGDFFLVFCSQCGAIYGVVPKLPQLEKTDSTQVIVRPVETPDQESLPQESRPVQTPTAKPDPKIVRSLKVPTMPPQYPALTASDITRAISDFVGEKTSLSPTQLEHVYRNASNDGQAPLCSVHKSKLVKLTVPAGVARAGETFWACSHYSQCKQIRLDAPPKQKKQLGPEDTRTLGNLSVSPAVQLAGEANLSEYLPYSPKEIAARMKLSGVNRGTLYKQVSQVDGPPVCHIHKFDMVKVIIPNPHKNVGRKVWVCPHGDCAEWRLATQ